MSPRSGERLTDVYVECAPPAALAADSRPDGDGARECMLLHRVRLMRVLSSAHSQLVLCRFRAPDAESVRVALRRMRIPIVNLWVDGDSYGSMVQQRRRPADEPGRAGSSS